MPTRSLALAALAALAAASATAAHALVIDFEDVALPSTYAGGGAFYNGGPATNATGWSSRGTHFANSYTGPEVFGFAFWSGWSASSTTDTTTPGLPNQYSARPGAAATGSAYGVLYAGGTGSRITLPTGLDQPRSVALANTTYAALSMANGDGFAKKFGGASGDDPDFLLLTITGLDALGSPLGTVEFALADFRSPDNSLDFIRTDWTTVDLTPLGAGVRFLEFDFASSDTSFGFINTPTYVAADNLTVVPEPSTWAALAGLAALGLATRRRPARA